MITGENTTTPLPRRGETIIIPLSDGTFIIVYTEIDGVWTDITMPYEGEVILVLPPNP